MYLSSFTLQLICNIKILNCLGSGVLLWNIHSCDKKFFPKRLVDMSDVGKVVPNKNAQIPFMELTRKSFIRTSRHMIPDLLKLLNEYRLLTNNISDTIQKLNNP